MIKFLTNITRFVINLLVLNRRYNDNIERFDLYVPK